MRAFHSALDYLLIVNVETNRTFFSKILAIEVESNANLMFVRGRGPDASTSYTKRNKDRKLLSPNRKYVARQLQKEIFIYKT